MNEDRYERLQPEEPTNSSEYMKCVLDKYGIDLSDANNQVSLAWKNIAPQFASFSRCTGLKDGKLFIVCNHPSKTALIKMNSREIMKKIKAVFPESDIKEICIYIDR